MCCSYYTVVRYRELPFTSLLSAALAEMKSIINNYHIVLYSHRRCYFSCVCSEKLMKKKNKIITITHVIFSFINVRCLRVIIEKTSNLNHNYLFLDVGFDYAFLIILFFSGARILNNNNMYLKIGIRFKLFFTNSSFKQ